MTVPSLQVTYRRGRAIAAYISLGARVRKCHSTQEASPGIIVDYGRDGRAIGVELASPATASLAAVNRVLRAVGVPALRRSDFAPLRVA